MSSFNFSHGTKKKSCKFKCLSCEVLQDTLLGLEIEMWNVWCVAVCLALFDSFKINSNIFFSLAVYLLFSIRSTTTYLHMFPQRWWMCVRFIATRDPTVVRFVRSVYVWMFLSIWWISKATIASLMFTFERLLTCKDKKYTKIRIKYERNFHQIKNEFQISLCSQRHAKLH